MAWAGAWGSPARGASGTRAPPGCCPGWIPTATFGGFLEFRPPKAGALCLMQYHSPTPSYELCDRIRVNQSVLIVPGVHLGLEGFIRVWLGGKPEFLAEGLRRIGVELQHEAAHKAAVRA